MIVVAIIGILAAIAIPNFVQFQMRSKMSEAKVNLKSPFTTQRAFLQEKDRYESDIKIVGYAPVARQPLRLLVHRHPDLRDA